MDRISIFVFTVVVLFAASALGADKPQETPRELRGAWVFDHADAAGESASATKEIKQSRMEIIGGKFIETWKTADGQTKRSESLVEIDAKKSPKQITFYTICPTCFADGKPVEWSMPGIYRVDGDLLTLSMGVVRPTEFDSPCATQIVFNKLPDSSSTQVRQTIHRARPRLLLSHLGRRFRR